MQYAVRLRHVLVYKSCQFVPHIYLFAWYAPHCGCTDCCQGVATCPESRWPRILWHCTYEQWLFNVDRVDPGLLFCFSLWDAGLWCVVRSANFFWCYYGMSWVLAFPLLTAVELTLVERGDTNTRAFEMEVFFSFWRRNSYKDVKWKKKYAYGPYRLQTKGTALCCTVWVKIGLS